MFDIYDILMAAGLGFIFGVIYQFIQMIPDVSNKRSFVSTKNDIAPQSTHVFPPKSG